MGIKNWLDGNRDFTAGVSLFEAAGGSAFFLGMFKNAGPTEYNKNKLLAELQKLAANELPVAGERLPVKHETRNTAPTTATPSPNPTPDKAAENRRYLDLNRDIKHKYTVLNMLMMNMRHLPTGEKLRTCAFEILKTHRQIRDAWALVDYYQEHDTFPDAPSKPERDHDTQVQYLRQSISRALTRLCSATCRDRAKTERLLKQKQDELAALINQPKP